MGDEGTWGAKNRLNSRPTIQSVTLPHFWLCQSALASTTEFFYRKRDNDIAGESELSFGSKIYDGSELGRWLNGS